MRLTACVWGGLLQTFLPHKREAIEVRKENGDLALTVSPAEASTLAMHRCVVGHVHRDNLRCLILRVPKRLVQQLLGTRAPRNPRDIKRNKPTPLKWAVRLDRAKCGIHGRNNRRIWLPRFIEHHAQEREI